MNRTNSTSDNGATFTELLRSGDTVGQTVERISGLLAGLEKLIKAAEEDLFRFYHHEARRFVRMPHHVVGDKPAPSLLSNAAAIIALDARSRSREPWPNYRAFVCNATASLDRVSDGLTRQNPLTNAMVAIALSARPLAETFDASLPRLALRQQWPHVLLENIQANGGGVAIPSLGASPRPHPYATYWAFRALCDHHAAIRAMRPDLNQHLGQLMEFAASTLYRLNDDEEVDSFDPVGCAFALATIWRAPDWLERNPRMGDLGQLSKTATRAFHHVMLAQRSRGHWRSGAPLWSSASRTHIYAFPADLLYGLFERVPSLLLADRHPNQHRLSPDQILAECVLVAVDRFVQWAVRERFPREAATGQVEDATEPRGWASSSESAAAQVPECWATAVVLRAAKATKIGLETAASQAARAVLGKAPAEPLNWRRMCVNARVRTALQPLWSRDPREPGKCMSAILAGPPGTGKTTLAQRAAGTPGLIYIAPHTLTSDGADRIPHKLEQVFTTLELLDSGVVLFDEIDEIVLEREGVADESSSRLLTTSMLPRFQTLKEKGRVSFFVGTNHIEKFDAAIRREGRFDQVVAVEFPDVDARKQAFLDALGQAIRASAAGKRALIEREKDLAIALLAPVITGDRNTGWHERLRNLTEHRGIEYWLEDALATWYQETLDFRDQLAASHRELALALDHLPEADPGQAQYACEAARGAIDAIIKAARGAWACAALVAAHFEVSPRLELTDLRGQLDNAAVELPRQSLSIDAFKWAESVHSQWAAVNTLLDKEHSKNWTRSREGLPRNASFCLQILDEMDVDGHTDLRLAVLELQKATTNTLETTASKALEKIEKLGPLLCVERARLERVFDSLTPAPPSKELGSALDQALQDLPASEIDAQVAAAHLREHVVAFLDRTLDRQLGTKLRASVSQCVTNMDDLVAKVRASTANERSACEALERTARRLDQTMQAWWLALKTLTWLVRPRSAGAPKPQGFLLKTRNVDMLRREVFARLTKDSDLDRRSALVEIWGRLPHTDLVDIVDRWGSKLELLHPMDGSSQSANLHEWLWRYSCACRRLAEVVHQVLDGTWGPADPVPCRQVPWGLPNSASSPRRALQVGEHLTIRELKSAAEQAVKELQLDTDGGLSRLFPADRFATPPSTIEAIGSAFRRALGTVAKGSRFYIEAESYEWRLTNLNPKSRDDRVAHRSLEMPVLSDQEFALLKEFPVLAALRADAEHDQSLHRT